MVVDPNNLKFSTWIFYLRFEFSTKAIVDATGKKWSRLGSVDATSLSANAVSNVAKL